MSIEDGVILPSGLLTDATRSRLEGFNKSYKDTPLRAGVIIASYSVNDPYNRTKLTTEYDVVTTQQNEDRGATTILYKKCLSNDGLGGIADFFEKNLRKKTKQTYTGQDVRFSGQNGNIVLLLCLDGASNKAIVIGGFPHPDRDTTLIDTQPRLTGEYNGINIAVNPDGSASLTFNGATDNEGKVIDSSQNATTAQIQKDGSIVILTASGSMFNMTKNGSIQALTSNGNTVFLNDGANEISINQKDGSIVGLNSTGVTISDATGAQVATINGSTIQLTSGGTINEQSAGHTITSGSVNITGSGGVKIKDQLGGELHLQNGMVALGSPAAELLDLFNQTLTQIQSITVPTAVGPSGPPLNLAAFTAIQAQLALIKGSL